MTADEQKAALLSEVRAHFHVAPATLIDGAVDLLLRYGGEPVDFERYKDSLVDEHVDGTLVAGAWTIWNPELLRARATDEERELFVGDAEDTFDPYEYGEDQVEWTVWAHEQDLLQRVFVVLERSPDDRAVVGNFRVYGGAQWLRETLWAATGVVPRDAGGASEDESPLFARAFQFEGREPLTSLPLVQTPEYTDAEIAELLSTGPEDESR